MQPAKEMSELPEGSTRVGSFGDSPELSEQLLSLIVSGRKRAGASLLWAHEFEGEALPCVGEIEIVVDHLNAPRLVTRTTSVEVVPFSEVTAEFAAREGEGDGSLAYWRAAHWDFFSRECRRIGRAPSDSMPVVCASFEVLQVFRQGVMEAQLKRRLALEFRDDRESYTDAKGPFIRDVLARERSA